MCACGGGGGGGSTLDTPQARVYQPIDTPEDCPYTLEQLEEWRRLLLCIRDGGYSAELGFSEARMNGAVGIVVSAINYRRNLCYFQPQLEQIAPMIFQIINSGKCP
jgi:hypothetical protein